MSFNPEKYQPSDDWHDDTLARFKEIGALLGWSIDNVHYTGFWSQGDGASFTGTLGFARGCTWNVRAEYPEDRTLHQIALRWARVQKRHFYRVCGSVVSNGSRYCHENSVSVEVWDERRPQYENALQSADEREVKDLCRDFMRWMYRQLEQEYEYQQAWELARAWNDLGDDVAAARREMKEQMRAMRQWIADHPGDIHEAFGPWRSMRRDMRTMLDDWADLIRERKEIADNFHWWHEGKSVEIDAFAREHV